MGSPGLEGWLAENQCSLSFSTGGSGRLFFVGLKDNGSLWVHERRFDQSYGLWCDGNSLWVATFYQLWHLRNILPEATVYKETGSDRVFCPRLSYVTGALEITDIAPRADGLPLFVNTRYSCLSLPTPAASFESVWQPKFISDLVPEDRCHLTGLAMLDGDAKFVTAAGCSDTRDGWRQSMTGGGVVIWVGENEVVGTGLTLPHSPRLYDGNLWLLNSGTGEFGRIELRTGRFEPVCFCPGFLRGLAFINGHAVIGVSHNTEFDNLPLEAALSEHGEEPHCGLVMVDLASGEITHWIRFQKSVREVHDLAIIEGVRQPMAIGFKNRNEIAGTITH